MAVDTAELTEGEQRAERAAAVVSGALAGARGLGGRTVLPVGAFVVCDALSDLARQWCARLEELTDGVGTLRGALAVAAEDYRRSETSTLDHLLGLQLDLDAPAPCPGQVDPPRTSPR